MFKVLKWIREQKSLMDETYKMGKMQAKFTNPLSF
jgi:hypothetical protein